VVKVTVHADRAAFEVEGWDRLWSLRSRLEIPLKHIRTVHADPAPAMGWFQGLKLVGTEVPNIFRAGLFYQEGGLIFWDVHEPEKTIVVELADERLKKLIVEVADPSATVRLLTDAIKQTRA
jgi:hypothetical protein